MTNMPTSTLARLFWGHNKITISIILIEIFVCQFQKGFKAHGTTGPSSPTAFWDHVSAFPCVCSQHEIMSAEHPAHTSFAVKSNMVFDVKECVSVAAAITIVRCDKQKQTHSYSHAMSALLYRVFSQCLLYRSCGCISARCQHVARHPSGYLPYGSGRFITWSISYLFRVLLLLRHLS